MARVAVAVLVLVQPRRWRLAREPLAAVRALHGVGRGDAPVAPRYPPTRPRRPEWAGEVTNVVAVPGFAQLDGVLRLELDVGVFDTLHAALEEGLDARAAGVPAAAVVAVEVLLGDAVLALLEDERVGLDLARDPVVCKAQQRQLAASLKNRVTQLRWEVGASEVRAPRERLEERQLAAEALARPEVRRLMTIPGVGPVTALSLIAVVGDPTRFPSARHLVGYLGLDPRVRQSGDRAAQTGHISRAGQAHARGLLVEAAHSAIRTPGPLRAFHARIKIRRGSQVALCATARKLTVLAWHMLSKQEDYRFAASTITQRKLRRLQLKSGDSGPKISLAGETTRKTLERRLLEEAERNYRAHVAERASGAGAITGEATVSGPRRANDARQAHGPRSLLFSTRSPAPTPILPVDP